MTQTQNYITQASGDARYLTATGAAWTAYTPTVTQSGSVTLNVASSAKYTRLGKLLVVQGLLLVSGTGTPSTAITISLPVSAVNTFPGGTGFITDNSASLTYKGLAVINPVGVFSLQATNTTVSSVLGADAFTAALAVNDLIGFSLLYEVA